LAASLKITAGGDLDRPPAVRVYGAMLGTRADASGMVEELVGRVGSDAISAVLTPMTYSQTRKFWAELGNADGLAGGPSLAEPIEEPCHYSKSEFFGRPLPGEAITALLTTFVGGGLPVRSANWTSCRGRVPTTAGVLRTPPSFTEMSSSSSSTPWR
jgi:hypothetical protein